MFLDGIVESFIVLFKNNQMLIRKTLLIKFSAKFGET